MDTKMTQINLYDTLERIRSERFSDLDSGLVRDVAQIQSDFMDNPSEAYKRIQQRVEKSLIEMEGNADA